MSGTDVGPEELSKAFGERVVAIGTILPMLEPWYDPGYIKRAWVYPLSPPSPSWQHVAWCLPVALHSFSCATAAHAECEGPCSRCQPQWHADWLHLPQFAFQINGLQCLFELYTAIRKREEVEITIILSHAQKKSFRKAMNQQGYSIIDEALDGIQAEEAEASVQADLHAIQEIVESFTGGYAALNNAVRSNLNQWFIQHGGMRAIQNTDHLVDHVNTVTDHHYENQLEEPGRGSSAPESNMSRSRSRGSNNSRRGPRRETENATDVELIQDAAKFIHLNTVSGVTLDKKISLSFRGHELTAMDANGLSDPYLVLSRTSVNKLSSGSSPHGSSKQPHPKKIHATEVIKKCLDPEWKPFDLKVEDLCTAPWTYHWTFLNPHAHLSPTSPSRAV